MQVTFSVNGKKHELLCRPDETLLDSLRGLGFMGVKKGCERGNCGSCLVLVDGVPKNSCLIYTFQASGSSITTIEGLEADIIQEALVETGGVQCGFCTPGKVISIHALLQEHPDPDDTEIRDAMDGNLCRCTGYKKIKEAIRLAAERLKA